MPKNKNVAGKSSDLGPKSIIMMAGLMQDMVGVKDVAGVWEELEDARLGANGFGGDVAEIYAYRLTPSTDSLDPSKEEAWGRVAADNLMFILRRFRELYPECEIHLDGADDPLDVVDGQIQPFTHRIHVQVASPDETSDEDVQEIVDCAYYRGRADALADALARTVADVMDKIDNTATLSARGAGESPFRVYYNDACKKIVELETCLNDARRALDEARSAPPTSASAPAAPTHGEVTEIRLCEASRLALRPGQLYRFTVASGCHPCEAAADLADPRVRASSHPPDSVPVARPSTWNALRALCGEAERFTLHTDKEDLLTKRSLLLAATALEYAVAHLDAAHFDANAWQNSQAAALLRWADGFRSEFRGEG